MNIISFSSLWVSKDFDKFITKLPAGIHILECDKCSNRIPVLCTPIKNQSYLNRLDLSDDARFPGRVLIGCSSCRNDVVVNSPDYWENSFIEDNDLDSWDY